MAEGEALRELYVRFSAEVEGADELDHLDAAADKAGKSLEHAGESAHKSHGLFKGLREGIEGIAAVFIGSELFSSIKETASELSNLADLSIQTGIAAENIEFFGFVASQAGGSAREFQSQLGLLQRALSKTEKATSPQAAALKQLGIHTDDAEGNTRSLNEVLPEIFENFGNVKDANEQAAIALQLFGRSGTRMLQALRSGKAGLEQYREQFEELGGAAPEEALAKAKAFGDAIERVKTAANRLKVSLFTGVLPKLADAADLFAKVTGKLSKFLEGTTAGEHAVLGLAAVLAGPLFKALGPFLTKGLKFLAIYAAVDDVLAFLEGKDSLIGRLLDKIFGEGTADAARAWAKDAISALGDFRGSAQATYEAITSKNSTFTEKALASIVGMIRDASNGFPVLQAGFSATLDNMLASLIEFVASGLDTWNGFVEGIKIPPALEAIAGALTGGAAIPAIEAAKAAAGVAKVDTTGLHDDAGTLRKRANESTLRAGAIAAGAAKDVDAEGASAFLAAQRAKGPAARTAATLTGEAAIEGRKGEQFATLTAGAAAGVSATLNDNKSITLNFKEGTSDDFKKQVKQAVADALKDDNRIALQQIAQRAEPKKK